MPDLIQSIRSLRTRWTGTNYQVALNRAISTFEQFPNATDRNLIFISDGDRNRGTSGAAEVAHLRAMDVNLQAFAVGYDAPVSSLQGIDPDPYRFGDADELYDVFSGLTPGGIEFLEPALPGWTVFLDLNANGVLDPGEPWTTSNEDGIYEFTGLAPAEYALRAVPQYGWQQTQPWAGHYVVDLQPGATVRARDFGFYESPQRQKWDR